MRATLLCSVAILLVASGCRGGGSSDPASDAPDRSDEAAYYRWKYKHVVAPVLPHIKIDEVWAGRDMGGKPCVYATIRNAWDREVRNVVVCFFYKTQEGTWEQYRGGLRLTIIPVGPTFILDDRLDESEHERRTWGARVLDLDY